VLVALADKPLPAPPPLETERLRPRVRNAILECIVEDPKRRPTARGLAAALADA
jgi:hypothetical protein